MQENDKKNKKYLNGANNGIFFDTQSLINISII